MRLLMAVYMVVGSGLKGRRHPLKMVMFCPCWAKPQPAPSWLDDAGLPSRQTQHHTNFVRSSTCSHIHRFCTPHTSWPAALSSVCVALHYPAMQLLPGVLHIKKPILCVGSQLVSIFTFLSLAAFQYSHRFTVVLQALLHLGLPVGEPCITLDGVERVGLPLKHNGVSVAWQVVPPAWCSRNPPHSPTAEAQMHRWALQYRGYTVLTVPFHEWAPVLESGDVAVQAGYLQNMLNGLSVRRRVPPP